MQNAVFKALPLQLMSRTASLCKEDSVASTLLLKNWNSSGPLLEQLFIAPTVFLLLNAVKDRQIIYKIYNFIKGT